MAGYYKGSTVRIIATFKSLPGGAPLHPDSVTISFVFFRDKKETHSAEFPMALEGDTYVYAWDSAQADTGRFTWRVIGIIGEGSAMAGGSDELFQS